MNHKTVSSVSTRQFRRIASLASCALLLHVAPLPAQDIWNGSAATTNWSSAGNWSFGVIPGTADTVEFDNIIPGAASGVVDNIVDTGFTIGSLIYQTASTNGFHTTSIPLSLSLNINGNGLGNPAGNIVYVGTGVPANTESITYRVVGPGTLSITNTNGVISIVQGGANNDHFATLDLTGLTNFSCSVTQMFVGCIADTATFGVRPMGIMRLAETNYIQTAAGVNSPGIMVACYPTSDTSLRGTEQLFFGRHNVISSDAISVGGTKTTGSINSRPGVPSAFASLRGSAGGSDKVKLLTIGDGRAGMFNYVAAGTTVASSGTFDASGTFLDALVQDLYVARSQTNNNGATTGILTFDQGSITADNVYVGFHPAPAATSGTFNGTGTINVNGNATLNVNNDLLLTRKLGPTVPVATLNISSNGTVNVKGNVVTSNGTSTITFNGGLLNMQPAGDATPGNVTVGALAGNGTITNAANVTNSASLTPGTSSTAGTLSIYGNFMLSNNAPVNFNLTNVTTVGSGLNDYVSVAGNVTLNSNNLVLTPVSSTLAGGTYRVMDYTGARNGFLNFTNQTRYSLGLGYPAGQINLTNSGGAPASLRWAGTSSALWDLATSNWFNTGSSASDRFFAYDTTLVDDSGAYTNLLLVNTTLYPGSVTVSSSTRDYSFGGSGKISGGASLTKQGSSTLTISNANDFSGPAVISAGTLKTANGSALGSTNSGTTIASGATLDLFGASLFSPGEAVTVSGTGVGGNGAIINSGADQQNGLRFITLAGDTAVSSSSPGRWDLRGPGGAGSFNAALNLNGFTMTKLGAGKQSLVDSTITNAGSIIISNGILGLTRSLIDGPGTITSIGTNFVQIENSSTGYIAKPMTFNGGGGTLQVVGNAFTLFSSVTNNGGLTIDSQVGLTLTNIISGPGSLAKISAGTLTLQAPDLGTGPTTISAGRVVLTNAGSFPNTPSITLGSGAILDASGVGGLTLVSGQTLSGSGSIVGDVTSGSGTGIIPGSSPGTLTFSNSLSLNNSSNVFDLAADPTQIGGGVNDLILVNGNLTLSGVTTIKIVPLATLNNGSPYTLFQYSGTLTGGAANLNVASDSRYAFSVVDPTTTPGSIQVIVNGSGASASLTWKGGAVANPRAWDTKITSNWIHGVSSDVFFLGDNVLFDDTATTNVVGLLGNVQPAAMTMNNSVNYAFGGSNSLLAGSFTNNGPGTALFTNSGPNSFGSGFTVNLGTVTLANQNANSFASGAAVNAGTLNLNNNGANTFGQPLTINNSLVILNQPVDTTLAATLTDNGSGTGTLQKQGANALTLSGNNTGFNGPIVVSAGTFRAGNANCLGTQNNGTTVANGATLDLNGFSLFGSSSAPGDIITLAGTGLSNTGAVINTGAAQQNGLRGLLLSDNAMVATWGNRWDVRGPGGAASQSGAVNLNGFTLAKLGPAQFSIVDCDVSAAGNIVVGQGLLAFTRDNVDGPGFIDVSNNIVLFENNSSAFNYNKPFIVTGGILRTAGNALNVPAPITNNLPGLTADCAVNLTLQGTISGPGSLNKIGTASLILTASDSTWGGNTTIGAGTLQIGDGGADGSLPDVPVVNNGTLFIDSFNSFTLSGPITGTGAISKQQDGTLTLSGSNSFTGNITTGTGTPISGGIIRLLNSYGLGNALAAKSVSIVRAELQLQGGLDIPTNITFLTSANSDVTGAGAGLVAFRNVSDTNIVEGPITLTSGGGSSEFKVDAGRLTINGNITPNTTARILILSGAGPGILNGTLTNSNGSTNFPSLEKRDAGTWTLTASNDFTGNTTIKGGTLLFSATASINGSSNIDVQAGATLNVAAVTGGFKVGPNQTLQGNGGIIGDVTANGTVAPGDSGVGVLTFVNGLVLNGTTVMELDRLGATNADLIVANSLVFGGGLVVTNIGDSLQSGDTFNLFDAPSFPGSFTSTNLPPLNSGLGWDLSKLKVDGTIKVIASVATNPTNMSFAVTGQTLDVTWSADHTGWRLQAQTNSVIGTNWVDVPGSTTTNHVPIAIDPANGSVFLRLKFP